MTLPALIASDVDGTLLDDDEKITARTRAAVRAAVDSGAQFVLATGRPPRWVQPVVDAPGVAPMAGCAHDAATPQFVSSPGYEHAWLNPDNTEVSLTDLLSAPAVKLLIRKAGASSADMVAALAAHIGIEGDITYSTDNGLVEIVPLGISKASGIEEVARPLAIAADEVVAFGDMPNDVAMLAWAGHGVAMGNAHPEVLAVADEVTAPNTEDGVARVLERWWL